MPKRVTHMLEWRPKTQTYEVSIHGEALSPAIVPDSSIWPAWLEAVSSFSFHDKSGGAYTARKEMAQHGNAYWYAYRRVGKRMVKRYLGRGAELTLARLEEVAIAFDAVSQRAAVDAQAQPASRPPRTEPSHSGEFNDQASAPSASTTHLLLMTKLHVPYAPARSVSRAYVSACLDRGLERPLTALVAPPGFGKTTALRLWASERQRPLAWVSLDADDNDSLQFWTYVLTALNMAHPGIADTALALLHAPHHPSLTVALRTLLNAIVALPQEQDVVLILDDYHLIAEPAIHESLALLLEHPPMQLHLYLATRGEPPLPLARLRAYDQVNELRADDLRFRPHEVSAFLRGMMGLHLSDDALAALAERTEGWAAGLQLAGLSLQNHPNPDRFIATFGGSHRRVLTYLGEEVLAAQSAEVQSFLLQTSILERLSGSLCDAVTGRSDGQSMLERLEQANLFVVPLDDESHWYRYYHLFADLLRHRLAHEQAHLLPELHRRAACWLEVEGWIVEAVEQFLAVPDFAEAARVIEQSARDLLKRSEFATVLRLVERLPEDVISARPQLALCQGQALIYNGHLEAAERLLTIAEHALVRSEKGAPNATIDVIDVSALPAARRALFGEALAGRATLASMRNDAEAIEHARVALTLLPEDDAYLRASVMVPLGHAYRLNGQIQAAGEAYAEASRLGFAADSLPIALIALNMRAYVLWLQGRLREAADACHQIIAIAEAQSDASRSLAGAGYSYLATFLYEWNDLAAARQSLEQAIALGQQWANAQDQLNGYVWLAWVYQAQGQSGAAFETFQQTERFLQSLLQSNMAFPWLLPIVGSMGARLALRQGRLADAERWARERDLDIERYASSQELEYLTFARVLLALDKPDQAMQVLARLSQAAEREERMGGIIEIRALEALAWQAHGTADRALDALTQTILLAMPEGYMRLFVDEGAPMHALLARLRERQPKDSALRRYLDILLAAFEQVPAAVVPPSLPGQLAIEPLSEREREVLRLLAQGRSNAEIARQLVVAVSTVKTHIHHLFAKLQAADRLQAVTRAREFGLLDR